MWVDKEAMVIKNKTIRPVICGCPYLNPEIPNK